MYATCIKVKSQTFIQQKLGGEKEIYMQAADK